MNLLSFFFSILTLLAWKTIFGVCLRNGTTPLDEFIAADDGYYTYVDTGSTYSGTNLAGSWQAYIINMTSQQWLNLTFVDRSIWYHWLLIVVPDKIKYNDFATVIGTGNSNSHSPPNEDEEYFRCAQYVATHTQTITAVLYNIPNEPLVFKNDPLQKSRSEDAIIAFGWRIFSTYPSNDNYRYNWLTHFPMAKATVKAMDTVADFAYKNEELTITRFAVAGASKRGWSTWLTAAADSRIIGFVPIVMDMPNFHPNLKHMYQAYGGWTWAFEDYYAQNITKDIDQQWVHELFEACDPYYFFDRYKGIPKVIVDATNDEFFMPDDEHYWWKNFPEPKYFEMVTDAEHSMSTGVQEVVPSMSSFIHSILAELAIPTINWTINENSGNITLYYYGNTSQIVDVRKWHGRSCAEKRRDWRVLSLDNPCICGDGDVDGQYCFNAESLFFADNLNPQSVNSNEAIYFAKPDEIPTDHWLATLISIRIKLFDSDHPLNSFDKLLLESGLKKKEKENDENGNFGSDSSYFYTEYGEVVFTTQVSIVPNMFPFPMCNGTACYGTLV